MMEGLIKKGLLCPLTQAREWIIPYSTWEPHPPAGYVVSLVPFHECGFAMPLHRFLRGLLHHYKAELHHLTPNGILYIVVFIALCEVNLGIEPHFDLWKHFYYATLSKEVKDERLIRHQAVCLAISIRGSRAESYIELKANKSNKGWHNR